MKNLAGLNFKTKNGNQYFYDDNTGMVFPCSDLMQEILSLFQNLSKSEIMNKFKQKNDKKDIEKHYNFIEKWSQAHGCFFFENRVPISPIEPTEKKIIEYLTNNGFRQLILNVTEDCNFRCKYCVYSPEYLYSRNKSKNHMTFSTAKKAIDYYYPWFIKVQERNPVRTPVINFYGGEPLLELSLVKKIIEYSKSLFKQEIFFAMTTNGSLMTEKVIDYLFENEVSVSISLDGPKKEHDRLRVDKNGEGTFDRVMKNLEMAAKKYPKYIRNLIISVHDWGTDLEAVVQFFNEKRDILPFVARSGFVSPTFTHYFDRYNETDVLRFSKKKGMLMKEYFSEITTTQESRRIPNFLDILVGSNCRLSLLRQKISNRHHFILYTGSCTPGDKISVLWDGSIHLCERVNHLFPIGNIEQGLNFNKIYDLIKHYNEAIADNCAKCPITRLCGTCYALFAGNGEFKKDPVDFCEKNIHSVKDNLVFTYSILEDNPQAFTYMVTEYHKKLTDIMA